MRQANQPVQQKSSASGPSTAAKPAQGAGGGLRSQLKTMNYAQGAEAVRPGTTAGKPGDVGGAGDVGGPGDVVQLKTDLADPALARDDKTGQRETHEYREMQGRLFVRGVRAQDVMQGYIGDCYFAAALASVAQRYPSTIKEMFEPQGDDTYKVRFYSVDRRGNAKASYVTVDADFPWYTDKNTWAYLQSTQKGELWPALAEKAWAVFRAGGAGDYDEIGQGGFESDVMEAVTGLQADYHDVADMEDDELWEQLKAAADGKKAVSAGTYSEKTADGKEDPRYDNTGIHGDHAYSVLGARTRGRGKNKQRKVILRNPWGESEPVGDNKDDGIFEITLAQFKKCYQSMTILDA